VWRDCVVSDLPPYAKSLIAAHGLYTPRHFDVSPFFAIVKPTIVAGCDDRTLQWDPPGGLWAPGIGGGGRCLRLREDDSAATNPPSR
jgi:hypothetical protein